MTDSVNKEDELAGTEQPFVQHLFELRDRLLHALYGVAAVLAVLLFYPADIGISLPGTGEAPAAPVFIDGEKRLTLRGETIAQEFQAIVEAYVEKRFGALQVTTKVEENS